MVQERIVETTPTEGQPVAGHTTVIVEKPRSGFGTVFIAIFLVIAALVAAYLFTQMKGAEMAKDDAVAQAADNVGKAADQIGAAADKAGTAAQEAVDRIEKQ